MPSPDEYRKIAETYYRFARKAKTEADRLALLDLAKSWLEPRRAKRQSLSLKGAEAGKRGSRLLGECSTDYGRGRRRSTRESKRIAFPFEPRSENRGVHGIFKAVPHVRSTFIFDVHVELARV